MATNRTGNPGSFQLPQPGLFADMESGEGSVAFTDEFAALSAGVQLSILADWQAGLTDAIRSLLVRHFREVVACHEDLPLPERISLFRQHCIDLGVTLPGDFALMLQQG